MNELTLVKTVRLSNRQLALMNAFSPNGVMHIDDFARLDQRTASSVGPTSRRVKPPWVVKRDPEHIVLTIEGRAVVRLIHATDIFRTAERLSFPLAHCYDRVNRRAAIQEITRRRAAVA